MPNQFNEFKSKQFRTNRAKDEGYQKKEAQVEEVIGNCVRLCVGGGEGN